MEKGLSDASVDSGRVLLDSEAEGRTAGVDGGNEERVMSSVIPSTADEVAGGGWEGDVGSPPMSTLNKPLSLHPNHPFATLTSAK